MGQGSPVGSANGGLFGVGWPARRWRLLLAHDAAAPTCDDLPDAILDALGNVDVVDASSMEDARVTLGASKFDVCLVCLDLPPAPSAGARLAREMMARSIPVVLVTRSQRWIPADATELRTLPWMPPDATPTDVANAVGAAVASHGLLRVVGGPGRERRGSDRGLKGSLRADCRQPEPTVHRRGQDRDDDPIFDSWAFEQTSPRVASRCSRWRSPSASVRRNRVAVCLCRRLQEGGCGPDDPLEAALRWRSRPTSEKRRCIDGTGWRDAGLRRFRGRDG